MPFRECRQHLFWVLYGQQFGFSPLCIIFSYINYKSYKKKKKRNTVTIRLQEAQIISLFFPSTHYNYEKGHNMMYRGKKNTTQTAHVHNPVPTHIYIQRESTDKEFWTVFVRSYHTLGNSLLEDDTIERISGWHVLNKLSNKSSKHVNGLIISSLRSDCGGSKTSSNSSCIMTF